MDKFPVLILAKGSSNRLPNKNKLDFNGVPMFLVNVKKCIELGKEVYVSTDDWDIYKGAFMNDAQAIQRPKELCGDTPNIPVYKHAVQFMGDIDGFIAVQANSPTVSKEVIINTEQALKDGAQEVMTVHPGGEIYGSVWGMTLEKLANYGDPYHPKPTHVIRDTSIDIHTQEDLQEALRNVL